MSIRLQALSPLLVAAAAALPAVAQVPEGHAIFGTTTEPNINGTPGLFIVPLTGGPTVPVAGLPGELSTNGSYLQGTFDVSLRSSDGAVLATTNADVAAPSNGDVKLWVLHLNGAAVDPALTQEILLGTTANRGLAMHAQLPDGRVLVHAIEFGGAAITELPAGPMAGHRWAIVDPDAAPPTVTPLPNPPGVPGQDFVTLDVDPTGRYAYYLTATGDHPAVCDSTLLRLDLQTATECQIAAWPGESAWGVVCDDDGTVYVSSTDRPGVQHFVHTVVPDGCNPAAVSTVTSSLPVLAWGIDIDRASGRFVVGSLYNRPGFSGPQLNRLSAIDPVTGATEVISQVVPGGYGTMTPGIAVNNHADSYGAASDGLNRYWIETFPHANDYPYIGNTSFTLDVASAPGAAAASLLALSVGRASIPVFGIELLVDPAAVVVGLPAGTSASYALPVPANPALAGQSVNAQSVHLESNGLFAASRGLELRLEQLPPPTIASISPQAANAGTTVTVTGRGFYPGVELTIAGNPVPVLTQTATSLTFAMPAGLGCDAPLSLTNVSGAPATGVVNGTPAVVFSTPSGPAAGGNQIVITGSNLEGASVLINGTPLTSVTVQSQSAILGTAPAGTPGPATVTIVGPTTCFTTVAYTYL